MTKVGDGNEVIIVILAGSYKRPYKQLKRPVN